MHVQDRRREGETAPHSATLVEPSLGEKVFGLFFLFAVLLGLGLWINGKAAELASAEPASAPVISLLEPAGGTAVEGPLALVFETPAALRWSADGWQAGDLHIHAAVDGMEIMPGPSDIQSLGSNRYRWTLRPLPSGSRTLRLFWAGPDHRALPTGASETISVEAR